ncbi:hypothetical protein [Hyperthermus butylicus]|uniref:hypothetical protein n=1 Tax=Hyperthermus butylicus TaxID=54248 RepID=UPI00129B5E8B|nr:hypothetical protein [Hyperthermus butylicus]
MVVEGLDAVLRETLQKLSEEYESRVRELEEQATRIIMARREELTRLRSEIERVFRG